MKRAVGVLIMVVGVLIAAASLFIPSVHISLLENDVLLGQSWLPFAVGAAGILLIGAGWELAHD